VHCRYCKPFTLYDYYSLIPNLKFNTYYFLYHLTIKPEGYIIHNITFKFKTIEFVIYNFIKTFLVATCIFITCIVNNFVLHN